MYCIRYCWSPTTKRLEPLFWSTKHVSFFPSPDLSKLVSLSGVKLPAIWSSWSLPCPSAASPRWNPPLQPHRQLSSSRWTTSKCQSRKITVNIQLKKRNTNYLKIILHPFRNSNKAFFTFTSQNKSFSPFVSFCAILERRMKYWQKYGQILSDALSNVDRLSCSLNCKPKKSFSMNVVSYNLRKRTGIL